MPKEQEFPNLVTAIHIDPQLRSVEIDSRDGPTLRFTLAPFGIVFEASDLAVEDRPHHLSGDYQEVSEGQERSKPITLTGQLKAKPREGRNDRTGKQTAYARFSAHVEGEDSPHDYIATFHRHTAAAALSLQPGDQLTVQGYPHPSNSPKRLDTFSVLNIVNHSSQPRKR